MKTQTNPFIISLIVMVIWLIIIMGGQFLQAGQGSLEDLVTQQVVISLIAAPLFLLGVVAYFKWRRQVGLQAPTPTRSWLLLWFPAIFVLAFLGISITKGLPASQIIFFALINTILVGISEELMFRGIIFYGASLQFRIWSAIWITSILFGSAHTLNGLITGDFIGALAQALQAIMFGVWITAIRLRTKSLIPGMLIHGLWDFTVFLVAASGPPQPVPATSTEPSLIATLFSPSLFELPLFMYGLWLLRGIGKKNDNVEIDG